MTIPSVEIKDLVDFPSFIIRRKGWRCIGISDLAKKRRDAIHSPKRADHVSPFSAHDFELGRRVRLMRTNLPVEG